jgi:uncharacterized protein involved in tolerance to divalent cations
LICGLRRQVCFSCISCISWFFVLGPIRSLEETDELPFVWFVDNPPHGLADRLSVPSFSSFFFRRHPMTGYVTVLTTTATEDEADAIADALLQEELAACVQITPIRSRYIWKGEVRREAEQLLLIKTRAALFELVRGAIRSRHSYDVPEIVALPIEAADADYLTWMAKATRSAQ